MRVNQIMTKNPETLPPNTSIRKVAEKMEKLDSGFVPIAENGNILGAVTDRDLIVRAIAKGKDPDKTTAKEVMSEDLCFISETQDVEEAADEMCKNQVRRLLVVDKNKKLCGVLSIGDIATKCKDPDLDADLIETISEHN
jgi:CBS domain-containing protein